jgi:hypothetical protein
MGAVTMALSRATAAVRHASTRAYTAFGFLVVVDL